MTESDDPAMGLKYCGPFVAEAYARHWERKYQAEIMRQQASARMTVVRGALKSDGITTIREQNLYLREHYPDEWKLLCPDAALEEIYRRELIEAEQLDIAWRGDSPSFIPAPTPEEAYRRFVDPVGRFRYLRTIFTHQEALA